MPQNDNEILASKLGTLGRYNLQRLVAKLLPNNEYQIFMDIASNLRVVTTTVADILNSEGEVLEIESGDEISLPETTILKAVIGSGFLNMNPAVVTVHIHQISSQHTHITIQGVAKEGLIKQHAGEKVTRLVAQRLADVLV